MSRLVEEEFLPGPGIGIIVGICHSPSLKMSEHEDSGEFGSLIGRLSSLTDMRE